MAVARVLVEIRSYAVANRIVLTSHARVRMAQRNVSYADIRRALSAARACVATDSASKWKVCGPDASGDDLDVVVVVVGGLLVVTVY